MEHTQIITATDLENYADQRDSEAVIPELIWMLIKESVPDLTTCRIPYGDAVNQPGLDGLIETENGFRQFVPKKKSFWEIGTGAKPQVKATNDFRTRTRAISQAERGSTAFVFVTPRSASEGGWNEPEQRKWIDRRAKFAWREIKILDGVQLADWLREFPAVAKWLLKRMGIVKNTAGFSTPADHWENLQQLIRPPDLPLPAKLFLAGREQACNHLERIFSGQTAQLILAIESEQDAEDFVAAFLSSVGAKLPLANRCLFINDADAWHSMARLKTRHVLIAHPNLDLESTGEQLQLSAARNGHAVVFPISGMWSGGSEDVVSIRSPSTSVLESVLTEAGYPLERAQKLANAGALSLVALKRHLRGLGDLPPYANWDSARNLALANLLGRWAGNNPADKAAIEDLLGKRYGEWIEMVRPETLRSDTPLYQRNENWKIISRAEAWAALGPRLCDDDLDRFHKVALKVLGERDPQFQLPPEERMMAQLKDKSLKHSMPLRTGIAETLALLGSRPKVLASCSEGKADQIAVLTVRELLKDADWIQWASLNQYLPMLAEAAPDEFLDSIEGTLLNPATSVFNEVFAQEASGVMGRNYMTGLLWALETLAWHPDFLIRVTVILGELAQIDPGGNWANRPANSLTNIFLPWFPQTAADISKRKTAIEILLLEQPTVGWKILLSLIPQMHSSSGGSRKPTWRSLIPEGWRDGATNRDYAKQVFNYADLAITFAATNLEKLAELIDRLPDLPGAAYSRILEHLESPAILQLGESERLKLWEGLTDLATKHKKFADAQWAMRPDHIAQIETTARKLVPKSAKLLYRRLFSSRDFDLFDEKGDYEEQREKLATQRKAAIREILSTEGLDGVLNFSQSVTSPENVGFALGCLPETESVDAPLLPSYLDKTEISDVAFVSNFVWGRFSTKGWEWADTRITDRWKKSEIATFFAYLPFVQEVWERVDRSLGEDANIYWKKVRVNPWSPKHHVDLIQAVERLLRNERSRAALDCLNRLVHEKIDFPSALAIQALKGAIKSTSDATPMDPHEMLEVINWLQQQSNADDNALFEIEWYYLPLFDRDLGTNPKILEQRLANDPAFFCEVIGRIYRPEKQVSQQAEPTESERNIAQNAYRLLQIWEVAPGTTPNGTFVPEAFEKWLDEVKKRTNESGHFRIAMTQLGRTLASGPPDPNGLWIHSVIAHALNAKDSGSMRSGFTSELFNKRGVHGFSHGKEERELAAGFHQKANAVEENGFHRLATSLRELAIGYERDAEREAGRDPFDD